MNSPTSAGSWRRLKDRVKAWSGRHDRMDGRERQAAVVEERYGVSRAVARRLLDRWEATLRH